MIYCLGRFDYLLLQAILLQSIHSLLLILLCEQLSILLALLREGRLLLSGVGPSETDPVVVSVENCIEFPHENVSNEEHFLLDVHLHDCGSANSPRLLGTVLYFGILFSFFALDLNLGHHLRTKWSHFEFKFLLGLGQVHLLWVEHPLVWGQVVVLTIDDEGKVTEIILAIALDARVSSWDLVLDHLLKGE